MSNIIWIIVIGFVAGLIARFVSPGAEWAKKLAANQTEKLDWKVSIVDLMKLLKLDSSLGERKKLAQELGYAGALDGSAEMNTWLHKQVMTKVAESGGRVPENLKT